VRMGTNGNKCYHRCMRQRVTTLQIQEVCRELLRGQRRVGVRDVMRLLDARFGARGRTERIVAILKTEEAQCVLPSSSGSSMGSDGDALREQVRAAEQRALRAEELERTHQDFWAARYAEKAHELERRYAELSRTAAGVPSEQYLKVCQLNAELRRRLERYELTFGSLAEPT
jgi:hypothetical protein